MAFSKTLRSQKALIRNPNFLYSFFRAVTSAPPLPSSYFTLRTPLPFVHTGIYNRIPSPRFGPLFLSKPPWQLSQNATPLYFPGELVKVGMTPLNLIHYRKLKFPTNEDVDRRKEEVRELEGFDGVFNWPNYISFGRMCSGPVLGWMILNEYYISSFVGLAISGATDWLDGFVARRMKINSVVGSYLDPLADKVLIVSVAISMVKKDLLHSALVGLVVLRDVALVGGAVYNRASNLGWKWSGWYNFINLDAGRAEKVKPLFISKVNTVLQLTLIAAALLQPDLGNADTATYVQWLSWVVAMTTIASWAGYGVIYMRNGAGKLQASTIRRKHNI